MTVNRTPASPAGARTRRFAAFAAAVLAVLLFASPSLAADRWFHVRVDGADGAEVAVNLPLSLIEMAVGMIPQEFSNEVQVELNREGFNIQQLHQLWQEVKHTGDATFVTVKEGDQTIEVSRSGNYLIAQTIGGGDTQIDVRFPLEVVDALFSSGPDRLDIAAAVRALANYADGDMVTVRDNDTTVRVWVDDSNQGDR
jgi:hypothetical protein